MGLWNKITIANYDRTLRKYNSLKYSKNIKNSIKLIDNIRIK